MTKLIGIIQKIDNESVFIDNQEYILLQNAYKFVNKLKAGLKVELTLNDDNDISFFKIISETPQTPINKPIINKPIQMPINQNKPLNGQLFGVCLKLANERLLKITELTYKDEKVIHNVDELAKLVVESADKLYNEVEK